MRKILPILILTIVYGVIAVSMLAIYQIAAQQANDKLGYDLYQFYDTYLFIAVVIGAPILLLAGLSLTTNWHRKRILLAAGILFVIIGILLGGFAFNLLLGVNSLNNDLSGEIGGGVWFVPIMRDLAVQSVYIYAISGIFFAILGIVYSLMSRLSFRAVAVDSVRVIGAISILLSALILSQFIIQPVSATAESSEYATIVLMSPRNAIGIKGNVFVYDNFINLNNTRASVENLIVIMRADPYIPNRYEYIEAGYIQDASGFRTYGATKTISTPYTKYWGPSFNGQIGTEEWYHTIYIMQTNLNNNLFYMASAVLYSGSASMMSDSFEEPESPIQPPQDSYSLVTMTFTLGGGSDMVFCGSTGNDPYNTMRCHYSGLGYYDSSVILHAWSDTKILSVIPYSVNIIHSYEFYTAGGWGTPHTPQPPLPNINSSGGGGGGAPRFYCT